jgi:hypothetical protein
VFHVRIASYRLVVLVTKHEWSCIGALQITQ